MLLNSTVLLVALGLIFVWLGIGSVFFYQLWRHYRRLTKGITKKDLRSALEKILSDLKKEGQRIDDLIKQIEKIKKESVHDVQRIGLVRFNPFAETGGNQSFCLSILDGEGSGLVISGLHSRETTRVYAKPVKKGRASGYELSAEEKQAIKNAKRIK